MLKEIKNKHKLNKWFYFIPVIGAIIYTIRFEFYLNKHILEGHKNLKIVKKYKTIANLISLAISVIFIVLFFTLRNKHGFGSWPWFFWVGLGIGLSQNIVPFPTWYLYKIGLEKISGNQ